MNTLTDSHFISQRQLAPEHFPIHLDPHLYDSKKLAEIAIFKGAYQELSELANLIDRQGRPIDFLTIDGDHRYEGIKSDFLVYSSLVKEGGLIAFHDILLHPRVSVCEVETLWRQISPHYQHVTFTDPHDDRG